MLHVYLLKIAKRSGSEAMDIVNYLDTYNGQPGYSLFKVALTEGELDQAIGSFVVNFRHEAEKVQALVIEDNYGNVVDFLYESPRGFRWSGSKKDHQESLDFIKEHYHGYSNDLSYADFMASKNEED